MRDVTHSKMECTPSFNAFKDWSIVRIIIHGHCLCSLQRSNFVTSQLIYSFQVTLIVEGSAHPDMMCIPNKNVWNCLSAVMEGSEHPHMVEIPQRNA